MDKTYPIDTDHSEREDLRLRLAFLKESSNYRLFWQETGEDRASGRERFCAELARRFGIKVPLYNIYRQDAFAAVTSALDPFQTDIPSRLPFRFDVAESPITQVVDFNDPHCPCEWNHCMAMPQQIKPHERILKVDLSRKRGELLAEFTRLLDSVQQQREWNIYADNYGQWAQDNSRHRREAWAHLEIWRLRRQRKTFAEIADALSIQLSAAKKGFARAYEQIEGRGYDPERFGEQYKQVHAKELAKTCETCPLRETCTELCPDVLNYIDQDHTPRAERLINDLSHIPT